MMVYRWILPPVVLGLSILAPGCMSESYMDRFEDRATTVENRMEGKLRECIEESRKEFEKYVDRMASRFEGHVEKETAEIRRILEELGDRTEGNIKDFKKDLAELKKMLKNYEKMLERYGIEMK